MINVDKIQKAIQEEKLSGWLFFNFRHRDPISDSILEINKDSINSRGWFYIIFADREPLKIVHNVEPTSLDHLKGEKISYSGRNELKNILTGFRGMKIAVQGDINLTTLSYLDSGTEELIRSAGILTVSAAALIQRNLGVLNQLQTVSHCKSAVILYSIIQDTWKIISESLAAGKVIYEKDVSEYIYKQFKKNNLETEHSILTAFGKNSSDPHYETGKNDSPLEKNTLVQFDIWAKEKKEGSVYADISWIGYTEDKVPEKYSRVFTTLTQARDNAVKLIKNRISSGIPVTGAEIDRETRRILKEAGYEKEVRHRTGHSIDIELHGYGVNIDSEEFPDSRLIHEGSCFSIEPGLYFSDFGMRTEINCYIRNSSIYISGAAPQKKLLTL